MSEPYNQELLFDLKSNGGHTFASIGEALGRDEVWVAAAFFGQARFSSTDIIALEKLFKCNLTGAGAVHSEQWFPNRGIGPTPPTDPLIYRLYEGVLVYGHAIKAVIHEKFGDGIMSMIDCKVTVEKKPDPAGDRVLLTFNGKFLPYLKW